MAWTSVNALEECKKILGPDIEGDKKNPQSGWVRESLLVEVLRGDDLEGLYNEYWRKQRYWGGETPWPWLKPWLNWAQKEMAVRNSSGAYTHQQLVKMARDADLMRKLGLIQQFDKNMKHYKALAEMGREGYSLEGYAKYQESFQNGTFLETCACHH